MLLATEVKDTYGEAQIKEVSKRTQMTLFYRLQKDSKTYN